MNSIVKLTAITGAVFATATFATANQDIVCESIDGAYQTCFAGSRNPRITLVQELSNAPCIFNRSYGFANGYIWVDHGCRAVFRVSGGTRPPREIVRIQRCESESYRYNSCPVGRGFNVDLFSQLSTIRCEEGITWGFDRQNGLLWVDQGCRADFVVTR